MFQISVKEWIRPTADVRQKRTRNGCVAPIGSSSTENPKTKRSSRRKSRRVRTSPRCGRNFSSAHEFIQNNRELVSASLDRHGTADADRTARRPGATSPSSSTTSPASGTITVRPSRTGPCLPPTGSSAVASTLRRKSFSPQARCPRKFSSRPSRRNGLAPAAFRTCLEYGCGLGRITRWLSDLFEHVYGYDISASLLAGAEEHLARQDVRNVSLRRISRMEDIDNLDRVDLVYSIIVLQHNPPPIIRLIVRAPCCALNPGGVAYFQVPTYRQGYVFSPARYLANESTRHDMMEMHVLPQSDIFEITAEEGCRVLEVLGRRHDGLSLQGTFQHLPDPQAGMTLGSA